MKYAELPQSPTKAEALAILSGSDPVRISETLLALAHHESDWAWVEAQCVAALLHSDAGVRAIAATSLGHLARIHRTLHLEKTLPPLRSLLDDPRTAGSAEGALSDIAQFIQSHDAKPQI